MNRIKVQYIAIALAVALAVWLSFKGFNSNSLQYNPASETEAASGTEHNHDIADAITKGDKASLEHLINDYESGAGEIPELEIIPAYEFLIEDGSLSDNSKVKYADIRIRTASTDLEVMKGVRTVLGVIKRDSTHIPALELLGEMSLKSGQLDKAKERYQKLLTLQPENDTYKKALQAICEQLGEACD